MVLGGALLFVLSSLVLSCGGGSNSCSGTFDQFGNFVPGSCPSGGPVIGFNLDTITIVSGAAPSRTPTPVPTKGKATPTPTLTPGPQATSTAVDVGSQAVFHAVGTFTKKQEIQIVDITNSRDILWTSANNPPGGADVLLPPSAGNGGIYNAVSSGCACIDASAGGVSALPVGVTVNPTSGIGPACSPCPTPVATASPALTRSSVGAGAPQQPGITGQLKWVFDPGISLAGPIVPGPEGRVYFITADGMLHALDSNGRERWRRPSGGVAPVVSNNGTVFVLDRQASLNALSPKGRPLWTIALDSAGEPVAASGDTAYVKAGGELWAVIGPGLVQWRAPANGDITAAAVTSDSGILAGANGGALTAFSSEGIARWTFEPEGGFAGQIVTVDDTVYAGSGAGMLYAIDASTGSELWHLGTFGPVSAGPVAGLSGLLFFESDSLYAVGSDGRIAWQKKLIVPGPLASDPAGGVFAPDAGKRDALFNADGSVRWSTRSFGPVAETAVSADGMLYVATTDARVYAVR